MTQPPDLRPLISSPFFPMRNFKLTVAYDGTDYFGWQAQADKATVQVTLEAAVEQITGEKVRLSASGRTDAGVHALGQVACFRGDTLIEPAILQKALNAVLPDDIAVLEVCEVPADFHPRYSARRKHYRYVIYNGPVRDIFARRYSWHFKKGRLDAEAMHRAARPLLGKHDFASFESSGAKRKTSVRTIFSLEILRGRGGQGESPFSRERAPTEGWSASTSADSSVVDRWPLAENKLFFPTINDQRPTADDWIILDIVADGFLYNMVRAILGTLVEVGRGVQSETWPGEVLLAADRRRAGPTAPPQGLFLVEVSYVQNG
jgi:tRNA pseudouridine38-40 synthase